jgi:L-malate glycosyltransferase
MRLLWIVNGPIGKHCELTGTRTISGSWLVAYLEDLRTRPDFEICVVTTWIFHEPVSYKDGNIEYLLLPGGYPIQYNPGNRQNILLWENLIRSFKPDIIHIYGTERPLGHAAMEACPDCRFILTLQGLCGIIERYYYGGIPIFEMLKQVSLRDLVRFDTLFHAKRKFRRIGASENRYFMKIKHVIGHTTWDFVHAWTVNPAIHYHLCQNIMRKEFYEASWDINQIDRHSIFTIQGEYPLKGMYMLLKALAIVKREFPDVALHIAGFSVPTEVDRIPFVTRQTGYIRILTRMIGKYGLKSNIHFDGVMTGEEIVQRLIRTHAYVCPSSIENSPNSVSEAQVVGVPCIASYVGGVPEMVEHHTTGLLYRFEEFEMLAFYICQIFRDDSLAARLSDNARVQAGKRHDRLLNVTRLMKIYQEVYNDK